MTVARVLDGDTFDVADGDSVRRIRVAGINAPEKHDCGGEEATRALEHYVGKPIRLVSVGSGKYGRDIAHVFDHRDRHVGELLVELGHARAVAYGNEDEFTAGLEAAEDSARAAQRGIFAPDACGSPPPEQPVVLIAEVEYDPDGDDLAEGAGEYVLLRGPPGFDLDGWEIRDEASHRFRFPTAATLDEAGELRVFSGPGMDGPGQLFWGMSGSAVWNNRGGDTVRLHAPGGHLIDERAIPDQDARP